MIILGISTSKSLSNKLVVTKNSLKKIYALFSILKDPLISKKHPAYIPAKTLFADLFEKRISRISITSGALPNVLIPKLKAPPLFSATGSDIAVP